MAKNTKSEQGQGERRSRETRTDTLPKAEEITCENLGQAGKYSILAKQGREQGQEEDRQGGRGERGENPERT